ncbi:hypothetical protein [Zunongwangia sp.]|uniref:hypothetical protein n=1 Tax=Zunongwangia sp. TaxID=1965325 RepID=UPI003AA837B8
MYLFSIDIGELIPVLNIKQVSLVGVLLLVIVYLLKEKSALKKEIEGKNTKIDEIALKYYNLLKDGKADAGQMVTRYENLLQEVLRLKIVPHGKSKTEKPRE